MRRAIVYDSVGNIIASIDANSHLTSYAYDADNQVISSTDPLGLTTTAVYDGDGNILATVDPMGHRTSYTYNLDDQQIGSLNALGGMTTALYDADGNVIATVDENGHRTSYAYDADDRTISMTDALGHTSSVVYDPAGNVLASVDANGNRTSYVYDADNQEIATINALGGRTTNVYDGDGNVVAQTDANSHTTSYVYDADDRAIASINPLGERSTVVYDSAGNIVNSIDPLGRTTTYVYDADNRAIASTNPLNETTSTVYDAAGNVIANINALGAATTYTYDADDRLISYENALGNFTTITYDADGNQTHTEDARGHSVTITYDALNRPTSITEPFDSGTSGPEPMTTTMVYDAVGNMTSVIQLYADTAAPMVTTLAYDAINREVSTETPDGAFTTTVYDAVGNTIATVDALGNRTSMTFNALNEMVTQKDALGAVTSFAYDAVGNATSLTDPDGNTTTFVYDAANQEINQIDPFGHMVTYSYDAAGELTSKIDQLGRQTTYAYDGAGEMIGDTWLTSSGATSNIQTFTYDAAGDLTSAHDNTNGYVTGATLSYDALGELTSMQNVSWLPSVTYAYDADGDVISAVDSAGGVTTSIYGAEDNLEQRSLTASGENGANIDFHYDLAGRLILAARYDNTGSSWGLVGSTVYDYASNQSSLAVIETSNASNADVLALTYTYDLDERVSTLTGEGSGTTSYTYNADSELMSENSNSYSYDSNGNRNMSGYSTGTDNEITSDGTYTYTYDAAGNMTEKYTISSGNYWTYSYNQLNQLTTVNYYTSGTGLTQQENYQYDVFGNLVREVDYQWVSGTWTSTDIRHAYDMNGQVIADVNSSGTVLTRYLTGDDGTIYARVNTSTGSSQPSSGWLLTDALGSVVAVQSLDGTSMLDQLSYDAYGNITSETNSAQRGAFGFTGLRTDALNGLAFAMHRVYDSQTGQWLENDPIGFLGGDANTRRDVGNDPTNEVDRSGLAESAAGIDTVIASIGVISKVLDPILSPTKPASSTSTAGQPQLMPAPSLPQNGSSMTKAVAPVPQAVALPSDTTAKNNSTYANSSILWMAIELAKQVPAAGPSTSDGPWDLLGSLTPVQQKGPDLITQINNMPMNQKLTAGSAPVYNIPAGGNQTASQALAQAPGEIEKLLTYGFLPATLVVSVACPLLPMTMGLSSAAINAREGNYRDAFRDLALSIVPFLPNCAAGARLIPILKGELGAEEILRGAASYMEGNKLEGILTIVGGLGLGLDALFGPICFSSGTPLRTPDGSKPIEEFQVGDFILSRDQYNPTGPIEPRRVEKIYRKFGRIFHLHVGGQVIRTTAEHPFFVKDRGWEACCTLKLNDELLLENGRWMPVEDLLDTGESEVVYNVTICDWHTYFVGGIEWDFALWAHNGCGDEELPASGKKAAPKTAIPTTRNNALNTAKDQLGIPRSQPTRQWRVGDPKDVKGGGVRDPNPRNQGIIYEYEIPTPGGGTKKVYIIDHNVDPLHGGRGHIHTAVPKPGATSVEPGGRHTGVGEPIPYE